MIWLGFLLTFQYVLAHASHHIVPHDDGHVRPRLLDGFGHLGDVAEEKLLHGASRRCHPQLGLLPLAQCVNLDQSERRGRQSHQSVITNQLW